MNKLCLLSNQIVNTQLKLDKLNTALKQLNILQTIKTSQTPKSNVFEFNKKLTNDLKFEFEIRNTNAILEDSFNDSYFIHSSVTINGIDGQFWLNRMDKFLALKPSGRQIISFDLKQFLSKNYRLTKIVSYLIYDVVKFLKIFSNDENESDLIKNANLNDYMICIHESELSYFHLFTKETVNYSDLNNFLIAQPSIINVLLLKCFNAANTSKGNMSGLDEVWNYLSIENFPSNFLMDKLKGIKYKNHFN